MSGMKLFGVGVVLAGCSNPAAAVVDAPPTPPFTNGVSTLAGAAEANDVDGDRDVARFDNPVNVAYGPDGNVYVADFDNSKLRVVTADGTTSTIIAQATFIRP